LFFDIPYRHLNRDAPDGEGGFIPPLPFGRTKSHPRRRTFACSLFILPKASGRPFPAPVRSHNEGQSGQSGESFANTESTDSSQTAPPISGGRVRGGGVKQREASTRYI